jgi:hypothetical protein
VLAELRAALPLHGERAWVLMHIPPGIDTYSTIQLAHEFLIVPLLDPAPRTEAVNLLEQPERNVALVLTGHVHRFSFRIFEHPGEAVALMTIPAISPIYGNTPSFLTGDVGADGTLIAAEEHALVDGAWQNIGGTRTLGMRRVDPQAIGSFDERLGGDAALRAAWSRLYNGAAHPEITERNWRGYHCATFSTTARAFRECLGVGGFGIFTSLGIVVAAAGLALLAGLASGVVLLLRRARGVSAR